MSRVWTIVAVSIFFVISLFNYAYPHSAIADAGSFEVNVEYLKNAKFTSDQKLLELRVNMLERTPRKIKFYAAPKSSKIVECTFGSSMKTEPLDCGLVPMSLFLYVEYSYVFKVLNQEGDWLQLSAPFAATETLWLNKAEYPDIDNDPSAEIAVSVKPISEWVLSLYGLDKVDKSASIETYIYASPDNKGKVFGICKPASYNTRSGLMKTRGETEKTKWGEIKGDWVKVFCDGSDCYDKDSPDFLFSEEVPELHKEKERRKKLKSCIRGWARWRSTDGHVLLYPSYMVSH